MMINPNSSNQGLVLSHHPSLRAMNQAGHGFGFAGFEPGFEMELDLKLRRGVELGSSGVVLDHHSWFNDSRFDGSFPSRVLSFLYLGNL